MLITVFFPVMNKSSGTGLIYYVSRWTRFQSGLLRPQGVIPAPIRMKIVGVKPVVTSIPLFSFLGPVRLHRA